MAGINHFHNSDDECKDCLEGNGRFATDTTIEATRATHDCRAHNTYIVVS